MSKKTPKKSSESKKEENTLSTVWIVVAALAIPAILLGVWNLTTIDRTESYTYNGFLFEQVPCEVGMCWETVVVSNVGEHPVLFMNGPQEVEDVTIDPSAVERVLNLTHTRNSSVTIAFDEGVPGEVGIAAANIARITGERFYRIPTTGGIYNQDITCSAATPARSVIYLTQLEATGAFLEEDCILVTAPNTQELVLASDALTLHLLQIMQ